METYVNYFTEALKKELGERGEGIAKKFIKFIKEMEKTNLEDFYKNNSVEDIYLFCKEFLNREDYLKENAGKMAFKIINALKESFKQYEDEIKKNQKKATIKAAIAAILSGTPTIDSEILEKTREYINKINKKKRDNKTFTTPKRFNKG